MRYRESGVLVKREIVDIQRRQKYLCTYMCLYTVNRHITILYCT